MIKKICALFTAVALMAGGCLLAGCSADSPSEATVAYLTKLKSEGVNELLKLDQNKEVGSLFGDDGSLTEDQQKIMGDLLAKMVDFDYEVKNETIDGDSAQVEVAFKNYEIGKALSSSLTDYLSKAFTLALGGTTDEAALTQLFYDTLDEKLDALTEKTHESTVTLSLTKTDSGWEVNSLGNDQYDAMLGGLFSAINSLESFGS
ncbi:MAG: hypothetical protein Q4D06_07540 [Coriobacteriia bacterium]|nr:hypothetical protein [Coriobacteriia bacterium]